MQQHEALERVGAVCFTINHIQDILVNLLAHAVSHAPVVTRARAIFMYVEVLGIVDVLVCARLDRVEHPWLEIEENGAWDVPRVVRLVEEDVLAVATFGRKVFEVAVAVDAVLLTQLLPELLPNAVAALAGLQCYYLSGRVSADEQVSGRVSQEKERTWAWCLCFGCSAQVQWWHVDAFWRGSERDFPKLLSCYLSPSLVRPSPQRHTSLPVFTQFGITCWTYWNSCRVMTLLTDETPTSKANCVAASSTRPLPART
jgi:hypothetical protein